MVVRLAAQSVSSELGKERCRKSGPQMDQLRLCWLGIPSRRDIRMRIFQIDANTNSGHNSTLFLGSKGKFRYSQERQLEVMVAKCGNPSCSVAWRS